MSNQKPVDDKELDEILAGFFILRAELREALANIKSEGGE